MTIPLTDFLSQVFSNPMLAVTVALTLGVIMVNGWTDAPNAIATCVSTRSMRAPNAIIMAAVFNFLGVLVMTLINSKVAMTIYNMVDFGGNTHEATVALCAALFAIVVWATAAWAFGIPTSESHALIAGLSGAAIALHSSLDGINFSEWVKVLYGLALSTVLGFGTGFAATRLTERCCRNLNRRKTTAFFKKAQIAGGAGMAFMHGAQDGQKFIGVLLLGRAFAMGQTGVTSIQPPLWLMLLSAAAMGLGTAMGGRRIIRKMGYGLVRLSPRQGFATDLAASLCLLLPTVFGVPVSTTHTKTAAILGVGAASPESHVHWHTAREMLFAWLCTFPGCGLIGFLTARLFLHLL